MNKANYKRVVYWVITILVTLILAQSFLLINFYTQLNNSLYSKINNSIYRAGYLTILESQKKQDIVMMSDSGKISGKINSLSQIKASDIKSINISKNNNYNGKDIKITIISPEKNNENINYNFSFSYSHIDINLFDSLLTKQLTSIDMSIPFSSSLYINNKLISENKEKIKGGISLKNYIDIDNKIGFEVVIKNPNYIILKDMYLIIITNILILLIIGFTFYFLIITIFRQKNIEQMRVDFTNNITHELKTPISVAYTSNDALINYKNKLDESKKDKYQLVIKEQLNKLTTMIDKILSISIIEDIDTKPTIEEINMEEFDKQILDSYPHIDIKINNSVTNKMIYSDKYFLETIIFNLIDNGVKYNANKPIIEIDFSTKGNDLNISVKDNGIGISDKNIKNIFDKYYRVSTGNTHNIKGYGLGLYQTKLLIDQLHGNIKVESKINIGTTFIIHIPINK